jgi:tetratricopeptide (TPR) repeat protein
MSPSSDLARALALALALAVPGVVAAQPAFPQPEAAAQANPGEPERSQADKDALYRAQQQVYQSSEKFRAGDFESALGLLREAEATASRLNDASLALIRFNIARCLEELGRLDEAITAYESYISLPDEEHRKQRAWGAIQRLEKQAFGQLNVVCEPTGALVEVAGVTEGAQPCPYRKERVAAGEYTVVVRNPGFADMKAQVKVVAGRAATLRAELVPTSAPPPAAASSGGFGPWPWVTIGVGVAAAGVGAFFTTSAISSRDDAESMAPGTARDDTVSDYEQAETLSWAGYGVGAAAIATGVTLLLMDDGGSPSAGVTPTPNGVVARW